MCLGVLLGGWIGALVGDSLKCAFIQFELREYVVVIQYLIKYVENHHYCIGVQTG
jgi:hypothetical protein